MLPNPSMTEDEYVALDWDLSLKKNTHFLHYIAVQVTDEASNSDNFILQLVHLIEKSALYSDTVDISSQYRNIAVPQSANPSYFQWKDFWS